MSEDQRRRRHKDDDETREKLRRKLSLNNKSTDNQCTICLNNIRDLSFADCCLHPFCRFCIIEWSKRSNHCPVCRTVFDNILTNVKSDSEYEAIPIEPPPLPLNTIPLINIVRDIIVSQDGRSTLIRTRISNDEGVTEITETRAANETTPTSTNNEGTRVERDPNQPVTNPAIPNNQSTTEIEEIGRFMDVLFHTLLAPEPYSAIALIEEPSQPLARPRAQGPRPFFPPPMMIPLPRLGPRPYFPHAKRVPGEFNYPKFEWPKSTIDNRRGRSGIYRFPTRSNRGSTNSSTAPTRPSSHIDSTPSSEDNQQNSQNQESNSKERSRRRRKKPNKEEPPKD
ncbi:uncharacterized protein LOC107366735 [Tetranychus urticae]|uniref:RING-type E3 ubiquitin transferase n=1 Tax=Tetranychus urticae TaxID=32264 RepID=T1KS77_TETUR|nr:uncharacterized protein LOC107366735 [Tetranychus urticae]